uniref:Uncharacterized protein n=1 Tax=viral metagenome TaxID=1070528 RepID=A0A6M3L4Q6_9ZZZZ
MEKRVVRKDKWGRCLLGMILALFILIMVMIMWSTTYTGEAEGMQMSPRVAGSACKAAMKYHGILSFTIDSNGSWFERGGERCKVWTEGCLKAVKGGSNGNN